jgi:8-oxo-dGTP pyrophosphatase MutT (NUDIX family)
MPCRPVIGRQDRSPAPERGIDMTIKHATASAFVFGRLSSGWRLGLIYHPRLDRLMIAGGHVEEDESQEQAVLREVTEESGLVVRLVWPLTPPLPAGYPHPRVAQPWWINEMSVPADNHLAEPHVHLDHQYVAVADDPQPGRGGVHEFSWYGEDDLAELPMFEDTKLLAKVLFSCIEEITAERADVGNLMRPFVDAAR